MRTSLLGLLIVAGCAGTTSTNPTDATDVLTSANETATVAQQLSVPEPIGSTLRTTANLNMRSGPGTTYAVRLVIPSGADVITVNQTDPVSGWYNIKYNGVEGWSSGSYLTFIAPPPPSARDQAVTRAAAGVGFSYWWGHGRWIPNGATSSSIGTCTGDCPNCTHTGSYGADCSGYLGKVWLVPSTNTDPTVDSHPYSTVTFNSANSQWHNVDRGALQKSDALVYNINGAGHIFLYESGDGWGDMWTYEARGCLYGIVHNLRSASTDFKGIGHTGW